MYKTQVIQNVIDSLKAESYLEIGVCGGKNFRDIKCNLKVGADPIPPDKKNVVPFLYTGYGSWGSTVRYYPEKKPDGMVGYFKMTSDDFFRDVAEVYKFDVIFIDGLHTKEQAWKDFLNSLKVLNPGGAIIFHDCNPTTENMQRVPQMQKRWTGDVWKCWTAVDALIEDKSLGKSFCVDGDYGLGVVITRHDFLRNYQSIDDDYMKGCDNLMQILSYSLLENNRKGYLRLISDDEFMVFCKSIQPISR